MLDKRFVLCYYSRMAKNERDFQTWIKKQFDSAGVFYSQCHPGLSADSGLPDLFVLCDVGLIPVELKIGTVEDGKRLWTSSVRPSQVRWHSALNSAGGCSVLLVGVWCGDRWQTACVDALYITQFEDGFEFGQECEWLDHESLATALNDFVDESVSLGY